MRRAAKVDKNQAEIVAALRAMGATVQPLHAVGRGCPDLLAGWRGKNVLIEIKDGSAPQSDRTLTPAQVEWHGGWKGQVAIAETVSDALEIMRGKAHEI
ncbi:MAG: hypothetical protein HC889_16920 [Synechococcaceae cyanobacterium SM1_2_3]|nr:hypothetical protein [Synechococcaceae cyanobacterium SM1_2_3]